MKLTLNRLTQGDYTEGLLYLNGVFFCDTLEDPVRDLNKDGDLEDEGELKIYGDTAIPYSPKDNDYEVQITWSPKFQKFMLLIVDVKHFTGIRIHGGVTKEHSLGCVLVGDKSGRGTLENGIETSKRLLDVIIIRCCERKKLKPVEYLDKKFGRTYKLIEPIKIKII